MAQSLKTLLFHVLDSTIGGYVEGLHPENLELGIWSGKLELRNLALKASALNNKLKLPQCNVRNGSIESLTVVIPWNRLGSSPVQIDIKGVTALVSTEATRVDPRALREAVRARLSASDAAFVAWLNKSKKRLSNEKRSPGFLARYAAKIVDNIEVSIRAVRLRYEDDRFACGLEVASFEACAANAAWERAFVERNASTLIRNVARVQGLALYCRRRPAKTDDDEYVLEPLDVALRATRNDRDRAGNPRYRVELSMDGATLHARPAVVQAARSLAHKLDLVSRRGRLARRHPAALLGAARARPVSKRNARAWWKYAAEMSHPALADARERRRAVHWPLEIARSLRVRDRYVELFERAERSDDAENDMATIELTVPFSAVARWRQTVIAKRDLLVSEAEDDEEEEKTTSPRDESEEATMADLEAIVRQAEEEERNARPPADFELLRFSAHGGFRCFVYDDNAGLPLLECGVDASAFARSTVDSDLDVVAGLRNLYVVTPSSKTRLATCEAAEGGSWFLRQPANVLNATACPKSLSKDAEAAAAINGLPAQLLVSRRKFQKKSHPAKFRLSVIARATSCRMTYAPVVHSVFDAFTFRDDDDVPAPMKPAQSVKLASSAFRRAIKQAAAAEPLLLVDVKLGTPTFIFPAGTETAFVVETGSLSIDGDSAETGNQTWAINTSNARVFKQRHASKNEETVFAPFGVSIKVAQQFSERLVVDVRGTPFSLHLTPTTTRELFVVASTLRIETGESPTKTTQVPAMHRAIKLPSSTPSISCCIHFPRFEFTASDGGTAVRARGDNLTISSSFTSSRLEIRAVLQSMAVNVVGVTYVVQSFGPKESEQAAQAAARARDSLPRTMMIEDDSASDENALFSVSFVSSKEPNANGQSTRLWAYFSSLRMRLGAATLRPFGWLIAETLAGLKKIMAKSGKRRSSQIDSLAAPDYMRSMATASVGDGKSQIVVVVGEVSAVLLDATGTRAIATAALQGAAFASTSDKSEASQQAAARFIALVLTSNDEGAYQQMIGARQSAVRDGVFFSVDYEAAARESSLDFSLRPASLLLLPGPLGAMLEALGAISTTVTEVFSPVDLSRGDVVRMSVDRVSGELSKAVANIDNERTLIVSFSMPMGEIALLKDAGRAQSEALVLCFGVAISTKFTIAGGVQQSIMLSGTLTDMTVALAEDGLQDFEGRRTPIILVDPASMGATTKQIRLKGNRYSTTIEANLSGFDARLSYRDALTVISILGALVRKPSMKEPSFSLGHAREHSRSSAPPHKALETPTGNQNEVTAKIRLLTGARITFIDDSRGTSVPLLKFTTGAFAAHFTGPSTNRIGDVMLTCAASFFNRHCLASEPLVSTFTLQCSFDTGPDKCIIRIASDEILELTTSTSLVGDLVSLSDRLAREAKNALRNDVVVEKIRDAPPLIVVNETELDLRCRATTLASGWAELAPGTRVSFDAATHNSKISDLRLLEGPRDVDIGYGSSWILKDLNACTPNRSVRRFVNLDSFDEMAEDREFSTLIDSNVISWRCGYDDNAGCILARIQSCLLLSNHTSIDFEMRAQDNEQRQNEIIGAAPRNLQVSLPLHLARRGCALILRRKAEGSTGTWLWSEQSFFASESEQNHDEDNSLFGVPKSRSRAPVLVSCANRRNKNLLQHVIVAVSNKGSTDDRVVELYPPILTRSRLPCGVVVALATKQAEARLRVQPGADCGCCELDPSANGVWMSCRIGEFRGRCSKKLDPRVVPDKLAGGRRRAINDDEWCFELELVATGDSTMQVEVEVSRTFNGLGLEISLSVPLWVVNKSGLPLSFARQLPRGWNRSMSTGSLQGEEIRRREEQRRIVIDDVTITAPTNVLLDVGGAPRVKDRAYTDSDLYYISKPLPRPLDASRRLLTEFCTTGCLTISNGDIERFLHVYVAVELRSDKAPDWLLESDYFSRATDIVDHIAIGRKRGPLSFKSNDSVLKYVVWRADLAPGGGVAELGTDDGDSYLLFFTKEDTTTRSSELSQSGASDSISLDNERKTEAAAREWAASWPGRDWFARESGTTMVCSNSLYVGNGDSWSPRLAVGASSFVVSIADEPQLIELDIRPSPLFGRFANYARIVTVGPRFGIRNIDPQAVLVVRQTGKQGSLSLEPRMPESISWHWPDRKCRKQLQFGVLINQTAFWAEGSVAVDAAGGHALWLNKDKVLRVEISLNNAVSAPPHETVTIFVRVETKDGGLFAAKNAHPSEAVSLWQGDRVLMVVPPGETKIIGWIYGAGKQRSSVLGLEVVGHERTLIDMNDILCETRVSPTMLAKVRIDDGTRVVEFVQPGAERNTMTAATSAAPRRRLSFMLEVPGVGLSIVGQDLDGERRELSYGRIMRTRLLMESRPEADELHVSIGSLQLDNHVMNALWPTFLTSSSVVGMESSSSSTQEFASLVAVTSKHSDETSTLRYLAVRILPVEFRADLSSLNTLAAATIGPIRKTTGIPVGTQLERCLSPGTHDARPPTYDEARSLALRRRGYIEALVLHPMEATLSFEPTRAAVFEEDDNDEEVLGSIQNLATISKATVRLKSFAVTNVMESPEELSRRIWRHYGYQILSQWHRIVGSLASIGSPINLVEDIGSGVREFFYAPSRGIVKSPQAFTTGLYTGTASLGAGVVGGLSSSIAGVGGVLSHNVSMLTGDSEFIASREARRRRFAADGGGASAGIVEGVETVATGLMQGVGGLLTKPVQGARSEGLAGLAAGTAQGVTGLAVKPVVGILDGASAVLLGISQTVVPARIKQIRPARALDRAKGSTVSVIPGCPVAAAATAASNPD